MTGTPKEVKDDIHVLECKFNSLKKRAIELLEASKLGVKDVVYELTTLSSSEIDQYKVFLKEKLKELRKSENYSVTLTSTGHIFLRIF